MNFVPPASLQMPLERVLAELFTECLKTILEAEGLTTCALFSGCVKVIDGLEAKCSNLLQPASVTHLSFGHGDWVSGCSGRLGDPAEPTHQECLDGEKLCISAARRRTVVGCRASGVVVLHACLIPDRMSNKILDMSDQTPEKNTIITCQMPDKMPENMSSRTSKNMPDQMSDKMQDRASSGTR